ncbi:hypothetical protein MPTK1_2g07320 [Marchantia polymorpha subsp. ruderalis]|uniref:Uncharacterized protein n=1 Tax=Marchantia polymorpha TaxID=3197 RepID=A0A2R6XGG0_MARPO|nr:hypothetical protein MARPO_0015s0019 [Marchantia polymorpha]BBN01430.1 hypothetical protein Mp_2g07320 [Marchantia polymorpha subsp. ruderalis]|eukprot:PTQ45197.1 hypothetical protein MARPO_0015s0019 [Marchantia polymorpha]
MQVFPPRRQADLVQRTGVQHNNYFADCHSPDTALAPDDAVARVAERVEIPLTPRPRTQALVDDRFQSHKRKHSEHSEHVGAQSEARKAGRAPREGTRRRQGRAGQGRAAGQTDDCGLEFEFKTDRTTIVF